MRAKETALWTYACGALLREVLYAFRPVLILVALLVLALAIEGTVSTTLGGIAAVVLVIVIVFSLAPFWW